MKKRDEIEQKFDSMRDQVLGTNMDDTFRDSALFKHGVYETLAWVLEKWTEA